MRRGLSASLDSGPLVYGRRQRPTGGEMLDSHQTATAHSRAGHALPCARFARAARVDIVKGMLSSSFDKDRRAD